MTARQHLLNFIPRPFDYAEANRLIDAVEQERLDQVEAILFDSLYQETGHLPDPATIRAGLTALRRRITE
jgi:hypothetical protein